MSELIKTSNINFHVTYIIYIVLALISIILTGMVLVGGHVSKGVLWTLFVFNIFLYGATCYFMIQGSKSWPTTILLVLSFILNLIILIVTNNAGNVSNCNISNSHASTGVFASASVFTVLSLLAGLLINNL